jgi:penicillin-binding protein 1A
MNDEPTRGLPPTAGLTAGERLSRTSEQESRAPAPPAQGRPARGRGRAARKDRTAKVKRRIGLIGWTGRIVGALAGLAALALMIGAVAGYGLYRHYAASLPDVDGLKSYQPRVMSRVYAGDARLMAELATERRIFVPFTAIPDMVKQAFVSAEDQNFYSHRGVDPVAVARAALTDLAQMGQGRRPVGASTITQQVAKNMLLDSSLSFSRKFKEWILAVRIEDTLSKERILELYLNEIYLGLQSYGVAAAAQAYFNKPLDEITLPEAAFLAALPKAPNNYNPFRFPDAARARRDWVLDRMVDDKVITAAQAADAKAQPVVPAQFHRPEPVPAADWFAEEVRRKLIERFGADTTTQGGLMVRTSMDPALQATAEHILRAGLMNYDRKLGGWRGPAGHLSAGFDPRGAWASSLAQAAKPPGMLPEWRLAAVLETTDTEARVGWLQHANDPRTGVILLSDTTWARPVHDGHIGGTPRRIADVMRPGDLVMVEPPPAESATPASSPAPSPGTSPGAAAATTPPAEHHGRPAPVARADRVLLRQIPAVQGALVCLDPATGRVLALVGGWSFEQSQFNRATQAVRQPGSSFKPIVYLTALEQGVSPSQVFLDSPFVQDMGAAGQWRPGNYDGSTGDPVSMHVGLLKSLNLVTIRIAQQVGIDAVAKTAIAFHVVDTMPHVLPASLGAVGTTVLRMAGAYANLAEGGREVVPTLIDSVQDRDGHVVLRAGGRGCEGCGDPATPPAMTDERAQIADPQSVFQIVTMMQAVVQHGTGYEAGRGMNRAIAGKTGTSQDFNDAWFVGFTPDLVTAVWVGFDVPASLGNNETGGAIAAPIWHDFMQIALRARPPVTFQQPDGVTLATWGSGYVDAFKPGQVPGASGPIAGQVASGDSSGSAPAQHGGVDSSMGGLY